MDLWSILQFATTKCPQNKILFKILEFWSTFVLGYPVVGRASPHWPLSSSTTAYFEEHQQANICYLLAGIVNGIIGNSKFSPMYWSELFFSDCCKGGTYHPVTIFIYILQQVVIWNLILHFLDIRSIISQGGNINSSQHVVDCWVLVRDETHMTKLQSRLDLWIKEKTLVVHGNVWAEAGQLYYSQVFSLPPLGKCTQRILFRPQVIRQPPVLYVSYTMSSRQWSTFNSQPSS